jgi:hypothetical protein
LVVGDVVKSLDIPGIPQNFTTIGTTAEELAEMSWDTESVLSATPVLTTINRVQIIQRTGAVSVNAEVLTRNHYLLIERNEVVKAIKAGDLLETDKMFDYNTSTFVNITELEFLDITYYAYSINCEPYDFYLTEHTLTFDNNEWYPE